VYRGVLKSAPDGVIKSICNAAFNVERGDVRLTPAQRHLFSLHRKKIARLTSNEGSIASKRAVIARQKGGFPFIPSLIGTALGALGGKLFGAG
jgi:phosphohistidine swiveling domain-containing protein